MSISRGTRFGSYEIVEPIGSGGMGEVYRARDTTLGRDVALKVLPASFSNDAMRVARFEQEAKTLASLNQSNIAHIYGLEHSDGSTGIVMELVDGETLVDRLAQGPIPTAEALRIANQIADALEAAHERGIVHRDLKPANIKLKPDGTVKVLDFGIAKALDPRFLTGPGPAALTTPAVTEAGFILGTAAYMSPEQARGKFVDQRTDIWAFGCVLYEMLTGKPAFLGEDVTSTLARVLETPAKLDALPTGVPPAVRRTLELCLEKDVRKRIADMRDVKLALAGTFAVGAPSATQRRALPITAAFVAGTLLAGMAAWLLRPTATPEPPIVRFDYGLPAGIILGRPNGSILSVAPSGELFVFRGFDGIYVRRLGDITTRLVVDTAGTFIADVAVSPDGRELAYASGPMKQLLKVEVEGGTPLVVADVGEPATTGISWEPDGMLYYGQPDGIWRVSHNGGKPERVVETQLPERAYGPHLLPGGQWLLFSLSKTVGANRWNEADIVIQSLATGDRRVLRSGGFDARYVPTGQITYVLQHTLFASNFDIKTLKLDDQRVRLVEGVQTAVAASSGAAFYSVANNGTLVFVPGSSSGAPAAGPQKTLAWVDRAGSATPLRVRPDNYTMARISPDGSKIALVVGLALPLSDPPPDIYVFDLRTQSLTQLTFNTRSDDFPVWSHDSSSIYYRAFEEGSGAVYKLPVDGGTPQLVGRAQRNASDETSFSYPLPWSLSPDGNTLLLVDAKTLEDYNLATLDISRSDNVMPLLDLPEQLTEPSLSPNGKWLVELTSGTNADPQVDIRPYPEVARQQRRIGPGRAPVFSPDGSEIFVFDGGGLSTASVQYSPFSVGDFHKLFRGKYWYGIGGPDGTIGRAWDVDPKNDRFLMITVPQGAAGENGEARDQIRVVLNWLNEVRQRMPKH
jgi:serine/threonine-protein kinase